MEHEEVYQLTPDGRMDGYVTPAVTRAERAGRCWLRARCRFRWNLFPQEKRRYTLFFSFSPQR
jgi:hypothetical protein